MKIEELKVLFNEYCNNYLHTEAGKEHRNAYVKEKEDVLKIYNEINYKKEIGEDVTELILYHLLPIKRKSIAPAGFNSFKAFGWKKEQLPDLSEKVWDLINNLKDEKDLEKQKKLISNFIKDGFSRGIQSGVFSGALIFIDENYLLINNKTKDTIRYISKEYLNQDFKITTKLENYIEDNIKLKKWLKEISEYIPDFKDFFIFDIFCHYMCDAKLGGYARSNVVVPHDKIEANEIAENTDGTKNLEELYKIHKDNPEIINKILKNPYCSTKIKKDYIDYIINQRIDKIERISDKVQNWNIIKESLNISLKSWNPLREIAPIIFIDKENSKIQEILSLIQNHKQIILYGSPGTSKTYFAKGISYSIAEKNENIAFVQFHPSYSYEDFIEGIFPQKDEKNNQIYFEIKSKIFKTLCKKAENTPQENFVIIIDEINRADLSKVFGEVFSALEYRKEEVKLLYTSEPFIIPNNLYIIGTMNTLDKSTVDIDFAFMRRFKFIEIAPDKDILIEILKSNNVDKELQRKIITTFELIQEHFSLGHAYFKDIKTEEDLIQLWNNQLSFLLMEYFTGLRKDIFNKIRTIYWETLELE